MKDDPFKAPPGYRWIFCPHIRHWRSGKIVYPKKGRFFRFLVRTGGR